MQTKRILLLLGAISFIAPPLALSASPESAEIQSFWESWRDARVAGDMEKVKRHTTEGYVMTRPDGQKLDREGYTALWDPANRRIDSITMADWEVRMYGDAAVASVRLEIAGISVATGEPLGFPPLQVTSLLVKEDGLWRAAALHATAIARNP